MWTLECDSRILEGKRIWLRPGKKYLFGRTQAQKGRNTGFKIDEKSVSRKHLTLSVSAIRPGDGSRVNARSEITLKDEETKFGTEFDGERVTGAQKILKNDEHTFRLGKTATLFRIKWQPVVLSFSLSSKELKGGKDPLIAIRNRVEDLDIKVILPYIIEKTTHVVSSKRNTAKGLQALINAKYIVSNSFVDALVYVTTPGDLDEPESLSPLEEDFDGSWPDALQHVPPKGHEPNERPVEFFAPEISRGTVFEGYTFVFCDQTQFESLQAPITNGAGKALRFELSPGKTSVDELVRYVKNVAGEKGVGEFEDGSEGKGVVVVKFRSKDFPDWAAELCTQVALALDQRLIEQNEFMDAILTNDASVLRRPLLEEDEEVSSTSRAAIQTQNAAPVVEAAGPATTQAAPRRVRPRGTAVSRFKGFDDEFDDAPAAPQTQNDVVESQMSSLPSGRRSRRHAASSWIGRRTCRGTNCWQFSASFVDTQMDADSYAPENADTETQNLKKRSAAEMDEVDEEDLVDQLLPAAAAMKRRRIEEEEEAARTGRSTQRSFGHIQEDAEVEKPRKPQKEVNIKEVVRQRREAEEDAVRREEAGLRDDMDGLDVEGMRNLAVVEEMELPDRAVRPQQRKQANGTGSRWDERWNGRKNFKKFRRQGEGTQARRGQSVIVALEEVKKKDFGIGEDYWLDSDKSKQRRKAKDRASPPSQGQPFATAREEEVTDLGGEDTLGDVDVETATAQSTNRSQLAGGKRPASDRAGRGPAAKKQKTFAVREVESESEDELQFRFKKRR